MKYREDGKTVAKASIRTFCYNGDCRYMGPTIVTSPGQWVNITLKNNLRGFGRITVGNGGKAVEGFHDPDVHSWTSC